MNPNLNSTQEAIISNAVLIFAEMLTSSNNHLEANFNLNGKKYKMIFEEMIFEEVK